MVKGWCSRCEMMCSMKDVREEKMASGHIRVSGTCTSRRCGKQLVKIVLK